MAKAKWQRQRQRQMLTCAGRCGSANCHVGIPPALIIATFIGPRWKATHVDEPSKDEAKFKVLELAKLKEAVAHMVAQLSLSFATSAESPLPPLPSPHLMAKAAKVSCLPSPLHGTFHLCQGLAKANLFTSVVACGSVIANSAYT